MKEWGTVSTYMCIPIGSTWLSPVSVLLNNLEQRMSSGENLCLLFAYLDINDTVSTANFA
jgi:hypothetical protein